MQAIRSILVVLDPEHAHSRALTRAKLIAGVTGARLHLLMCDKRHDHSALLSVLSRQLHDDGYDNVSHEEAWRDNLHDTIIDVQQAEGCELVIKEHRPDNPLKKALLTPGDWKLLRQCPCAVLMVKSERPWTGGRILAAVDVGNQDEDHRRLHASIIDHGHDIAALAKGELHVISAHPSPMLSAADPVYQLSETIEARYRKACEAFQAEYGISEERLHVAEGPADVLIPHTEQRLDAVVTVIGTVCRTGITGALIGNTAEVVLDELKGDVLVLKLEETSTKLAERVRG
ncbi:MULTISPECIES: universal stress protein [Pseudomonas]|uniref:Universal stress protein n=1 Tax=Pseudomonas juntendi TaxID=2666183 RepID=A0A7W2LHC3_9PSED|nr:MULTISPECIES: universal stress protein [Pseudomonas]NOY01291.1 universal stress protein [Gammaproteobacteria bacterium]OAK62933.1 universal stress protein UspA [Pseudomonas putida]PPB17550.1 universal stress protein UspA [Pseudomonas aeruginosa]MBA6140911.1 universal stress protein [Pseudomonas juntendi]MCL8329108.1 universal stress protein [Pseudomonas juntendi]